MKDAFKTIERMVRTAILRSLRLLARKRTAAPLNLTPSAKILFIRQDRIGDVLVSTPLFSVIKRRYPDWSLDVLLSRNNHFVLVNNPHIRRRWVYTKGVGATLRLLREIRAERYDAVVDLMDNPSATSTIILLLAGGKVNIGLEKENAYACDVVVPLKSRRDTNIVDRIAELLRPFGIDPETADLRVEYTVGQEAEMAAVEFLSAVSEPRIGINISAGSDTRFWGVERYRELMTSIVSSVQPVSIVLLGKPSDRGRLQEIAAGFAGVVVAPDVPFDGFAALISHMDILITPDTSAVHLAAAFSVPCVVLYVQSDPNLQIWEPYKTLCEPVITTVDDLSTIPVADVARALEHLLARMRESRRP